MSETHVSCSPLTNAEDGKVSSRSEGAISINTDGTRYITRDGYWRRESQPYAGPVAIKPRLDLACVSAEQLAAALGIDHDLPSSASNVSAEQLAAALGRCPVVIPLPPTTKVEHLAPSIDPSAFANWTESSTCRGILRALKERAERCQQPTRALVDGMERATCTLLDYDRSLGKTEQDGWNATTPLRVARSSLAHECGNAVAAGLEFWDVAIYSAKAIDAVTEVLAAIKAMEAR